MNTQVQLLIQLVHCEIQGTNKVNRESDVRMESVSRVRMHGEDDKLCVRSVASNEGKAPFNDALLCLMNNNVQQKRQCERCVGYMNPLECSKPSLEEI